MWDMVSTILTSLAHADDKRLMSGDVAAICDLLEDASVATDRREIKTAHDVLEKSYRTLLATANERARRAASGVDAGTDEAMAHTLGQISFAQAFAAHAHERRAQATFAEALVEGRFEKIVRALAERQMTGVELAERIEVAKETISRNLKELRAIGITDFRRDGTRLINFLTPPAAALVKSMNIAHLPVPKRAYGQEILQELTKALPNHMQSTPTFAGDDFEAERPAA